MRGEAGSQAPGKKSQLLSLPGKQILGPQVGQVFLSVGAHGPKVDRQGSVSLSVDSVSDIHIGTVTSISREAIGLVCLSGDLSVWAVSPLPACSCSASWSDCRPETLSARDLICQFSQTSEVLRAEGLPPATPSMGRNWHSAHQLIPR